MIRILIIAFFIYLFYFIFNKIFGKRKGIERRRQGDVLDEMVQDPFCKIYIPRGEAIRKIIKGNEYFFCSKQCASRFEKQLKDS